MRIHRFAGRRRLANRGTTLIPAFGFPLAALEACSDGDSSKALEGEASHVGRGGQPERGQSEGGDSSAENESPPGGAALNGEQSADKGDGTTASDGSPGGASATSPGSSAEGGSTPGGDKVVGTSAPLLNSPAEIKGRKTGQVNNDKILLKSKRGRFLPAGRQRAEGAQGGECKIMEDTVNRRLTELQQGKSNFHAKPSGRTELCGANGAEVDDVANVVIYVDAGGKSYRGWHWFRAFSTSTPAVYVSVSYVCPASARSEFELTKIIGKNGLSVDDDVLDGIVN